VSCIQCSILTLFNDRKQWTVQEIRETLGIPMDYLLRCLVPLIYSKNRCIANRGPEGTGKKTAEDESKTPGTDSLLPDDILLPAPIPATVKKLRITYPAVSNMNVEKEKSSKDMKAKAMEDRVQKIELALVRVMKARNVLSIQELIAEGSKQLHKFFKPNPMLMKKRIENLMERGFMRRDEEDQRLLHYCA